MGPNRLGKQSETARANCRSIAQAPSRDARRRIGDEHDRNLGSLPLFGATGDCPASPRRPASGAD
jgi:hypothetical protein